MNRFRIEEGKAAKAKPITGRLRTTEAERTIKLGLRD